MNEPGKEIEAIVRQLTDDSQATFERALALIDTYQNICADHEKYIAKLEAQNEALSRQLGKARLVADLQHDCALLRPQI